MCILLSYIKILINQGVIFKLNILILQHYSLDYNDFTKSDFSKTLNNNNEKGNDNILIIENNKLIEELSNYKKENENLKIELNNLYTKNNELTSELNKAKKTISNFNNINQNNNQVNNMITTLNEIISKKDKEITELKTQLQNSSNNQKFVDFNKIMVVNFVSMDQKIDCGIKCLETDTFAEVEEKLYQKYSEYRENNNNFLANGKLILRFKKICENGIKDGDKIQLINIE